MNKTRPFTSTSLRPCSWWAFIMALINTFRSSWIALASARVINSSLSSWPTNLAIIGLLLPWIFLPTLWTTWNLILVVSTPSSSVSQKHYKLQLWSLHVPSLFRLLKRRFSRRVYWCKDIWFSASYFNLPAKSAIFQFFNSLYMLSSSLLADAAMTSSVLEELDPRFDFLRFGP